MVPQDTIDGVPDQVRGKARIEDVVLRDLCQAVEAVAGPSGHPLDDSKVLEEVKVPGSGSMVDLCRRSQGGHRRLTGRVERNGTEQGCEPGWRADLRQLRHIAPDEMFEVAARSEERRVGKGGRAVWRA